MGWRPLRHVTVAGLRSLFAYAPAVMVTFGSGWRSDAFTRDRANVEDATPELWKPYPTLWLSKVHDVAVAIVPTDEYRLLWWEELQKLKGAARVRPLLGVEVCLPLVPVVAGM